MFLILLQPDLKSAIVLSPMVFAMLYVSKLSTRFFAGALAAFLLLVGIVSWDLARYVNYMEANGRRISKENQGKYIKLKSGFKIPAQTKDGEALQVVGNGSKIRVVCTPSKWDFAGKSGVSYWVGKKGVVVDDLVVYEAPANADEDVL